MSMYPVQQPVIGLAEPRPFHRLLRTPNFAWWRALLGSAAILVGWFTATLLAVAVVGATKGQQAVRQIGWEMLLATNLSLAALIPLSLWMMSFLHQRPAGFVSSVQPGLRWKPVVIFLGVAVAAEVAMFVVTLGLHLELASETSGKAAPDVGAIIAVVVLTSAFQAAGEEYFFRGYLLQVCGAIVRNPWFAILVTSLLFTMAHGVWPWQSPALFMDRYAFGVMAAWLVVRTGGLEAAIAVHAMNNIVTFIFAALTDSVQESLTITDAPWTIVLLDITKFVAFGAAAWWIARRLSLRSEGRPPYPVLPPSPYGAGPSVPGPFGRPPLGPGPV